MTRDQKNTKPIKAILAATSLGVSCLVSSAQAAQTTYRLTDLGALSTDGRSVAYGINNLGQVVGFSEAPGAQAIATIWTNGQISALGGSSYWSYAAAINDAGVVVGVKTDNNQQSAVQWESGQAPTLLSDSCCAGSAASASGINSQGVVVGWTGPSAAIWANGTTQILTGISPSYGSGASSINNLGQVVGNSVSTAGLSPAQHATLWSNGSVIDLGTATGFNLSYASSINDAGAIVGQSNNGYLTKGHATLWRAGQIIDLGSLNGGVDGSAATDINSLGQIVGFNQSKPTKANGPTKALIWSDDNLTPIALDTLIDPLDPLYGLATLYAASGINDLGQIVGAGLINGQQHAYVLTPVATVPEPGLGYTFLLGLLAVGASVHSQRKTTRQV